MAPESERTNVDKVTVEERWYKDGRIERKVGDGEWEMTQWPQNPPFVSMSEPTLTCSEVVERARVLAKVAIYAADFEEESELFARVLAAAEQAILRERRETLEAAAKFIESQRTTDVNGNTPSYSGHNETIKQIAQAIREQAPAILYSWRERRVQELEELLAKHSLSPEISSTQLDTTKEKR